MSDIVTRVRRSILVILALAVAPSQTATGQNVCDAVLSSGAFNTSDYDQTSRILLIKRNDVCRSEYNSAAEARSAAESAGGSIGWGPFSLGATDARQTQSGKWTVADSKFCQATAEDLDA